MIREAYIEGKRVALDPSRALGKGFEADVYDAGSGLAVKVWKTPDHPDYAGAPADQRGAEERVALQQEKIRAFPAGLPRAVVAPLALATDRSGQRVLGYAMPVVASAEPLLRYGEPPYRRAVPAAAVVALFRELAEIVRGLHAAGVVIGDFNDLNVLVTSEHRPRLIDADSFQFGRFLCTVFTERFVDPLLCDPAGKAPRPITPYGPLADWFSFNALLFQSLLCVGPYGGVHRPKDPAARLGPSERSLRRVTVAHPEVQYPKPATDLRVLPEELLRHFRRVFEEDERTPFPDGLLAGLAFATCPRCGAEHARVLCPFCARTAVAAVATPAATAHGDFAVSVLFRSPGVIVAAAIAGGELCVLHHRDGAFRREDGAAVLVGALEPGLVAQLHGELTFLGRGRDMVVLSPGARPRRLAVDTDGHRPALATNARHRYWVSGGRLLRDAPAPFDPDGTRAIGEVLANQTRLWVGETFGLGFYRAGMMTRAFVFDAERAGLNDDVRLPAFPGELIDASVVFDDARAWLLLALTHAGRVRHLCLVIARTGALEASAEGEAGDGTWLGTLGGKCATRGVLLAATASGLVRVEVDVERGAVRQTRTFTGTEELVDESAQLLVSPRGLLVVRSHDVLALRWNHS